MTTTEVKVFRLAYFPNGLSVSSHVEYYLNPKHCYSKLVDDTQQEHLRLERISVTKDDWKHREAIENAPKVVPTKVKFCSQDGQTK